MKILLILALTALSVLSSYGTITMNFGAAHLRTSTGDLMPVGGLVIIGASTLDNSFGSPSPSAFFSGDDKELYRGTVDPAGEFAASALLTLGNPSNWDEGDLLQLYWYPTLTSEAAAPGAGTSYGTFRTDSIQDGSDIAWVTPADGFAYALNFLTESAGGTVNLDPAGYASNLTAVPEPVAYAGIMGALCLGFAALRRHAGRRS